VCTIDPIRGFSKAFLSRSRPHHFLEAIREPFSENRSWAACITPAPVLPDFPLQHGSMIPTLFAGQIAFPFLVLLRYPEPLPNDSCVKRMGIVIMVDYF